MLVELPEDLYDCGPMGYVRGHDGATSDFVKGWGRTSMVTNDYCNRVDVRLFTEVSLTTGRGQTRMVVT